MNFTYLSSPISEILSRTHRDMFSAIRISSHFTLADLYIDSHLPFEEEYNYPFDPIIVDRALFIVYEILEPLCSFTTVRISSFIRSRLCNLANPYFKFSFESDMFEQGLACELYSLDYTLSELYEVLYSLLYTLESKHIILCYNLIIIDHSLILYVYI